MSFKRTLIVSLTTAGAGFGSGLLLPRLIPSFIGCSIIAILWIGLTTYALARFRWRGLWTLLGFPLAMAWPFYYYVGELYRCGTLDCN